MFEDLYLLYSILRRSESSSNYCGSLSYRDIFHIDAADHVFARVTVFAVRRMFFGDLFPDKGSEIKFHSVQQDLQLIIDNIR